MPTIRVDGEVYEELKKLAEPFSDTPNDMIRRLLTGKKFVLERLKKYIVDPRYRIELHDLLTHETEALKARLSDLEFPVSGVLLCKEQVIERLRRYESTTETMREIITAGCYWGEDQQAHYWTDIINRIAQPITKSMGTEDWFRLRLYPALLLLYSAGIASLARPAPNYSIFLPLYSVVDTRLGQGARPLVESVNSTWILDDRFARELPGIAQPQVIPMNQYLHALLRESFRSLLPDDSMYDECFNRFEYLFSLAHKDIITYQPLNILGYFTWRGKGVMERVVIEAHNQKDEWPPFRCGLFGGSPTRFDKVVAAYSENCSVEQIR